MNFIDYLKATKQSLTLLELNKAGFNVTKEEIKKYVRKGVIRVVEHYAGNSSKTYVNEDLKKENIKGTMYYTYEVI